MADPDMVVVANQLAMHTEVRVVGGERYDSIELAQKQQ